MRAEMRREQGNNIPHTRLAYNRVAWVHQFREFLGSNPFIPLLETNPLGVKVAIRETYLPALGELDKALQSAV